MKAITLRNLPPELAKAVRKEAERKHISINKAVISLLQGKTEGQKRKKISKVRHRELDALAGSWSKKEAAEFDKALAIQRSIDPELWK
jgi:plasmid stability protein